MCKMAGAFGVIMRILNLGRNFRGPMPHAGHAPVDCTWLASMVYSCFLAKPCPTLTAMAKATTAIGTDGPITSFQGSRPKLENCGDGGLMVDKHTHTQHRHITLSDRAPKNIYLSQHLFGVYLFSAWSYLVEDLLQPKFCFARFSVTVYTGSSSTGRKFVPAEMCFSPGRPNNLNGLKICTLTVGWKMAWIEEHFRLDLHIF